MSKKTDAKGELKIGRKHRPLGHPVAEPDEKRTARTRGETDEQSVVVDILSPQVRARLTVET